MKIILFSFVSCIVCFCLNAQPGSPDKTFGINGKYLDTTLQTADCSAMALQPDGKILTGGYTDTISDNPDDGGFYIGRFNSDGSVDKNFGTNGKAIIRRIGNVLATRPETIIIQPDNKIVAVGRFVSGKYYGDVGLIRLNYDGSLDESFGKGGLALTQVSQWNDLIGGMVLQPDGKIVVAGNKESSESQPGPDFVLRYMPDGSLDESFGDKGVVLTEYTSNVRPGAIALQRDGKIVTGGIYGSATGQFQLVRYNTNGSLDSGFGVNGIARLNPLPGYFSELNGLQIQEDGKFVCAGRYSGSSMAVARFESNGQPDADFGNLRGYTYLSVPDVYAIARSVFLTPEKKIILTGIYAGKTTAEQIAAVQYNENGILDSSFGENGIAAGGFTQSYGSDFTSGVGLLQPDGKIIVSGSFFLDAEGFVYNVGLFRFNGSTRQQTPITRIRRWLHKHGFTWDDWPRNNIAAYAVQRSSNGINWTTIFNRRATTSNQRPIANGNYEDPAPLSGTNYYRIQTTSTDGVVAYSNVLAISNNDALNVRISPNPAQNNLHIKGLSSGSKTTLTIVDLSGNIKLQAVANNKTYNLNIASLKAGNYLLKIEMDGEVIAKKFIKE